ncbi:hypothetical protein HRE53_32240 (plasmid) [Acaryochloris sp. 'Moss Beach']|uniref:hypothetical protein n=1 Tax=Acaryochloris sp. 'Moss Beach' TaxID=2740837 RepID=UPI001F173177|nr:hypothetical protein [Acaryochloris sp. 'Moss Beach']UJB73322.1 hypothetical protein HRE53_32240 [Acaryochloris sp. 'Moss Beach']
MSSSLRIGANGNDGDILLFRGNNTSIETPTEDPSIRLDGQSGSIIGQRFRLSSSLRIGANGNDGDILLFRGNNTSIETPTEDPSIRLDGQSGSIIGQRFRLSSSLRIGANGNDGDILLFRGNNTSIETPTEDPSIRLDGQSGSIIGQRFRLSSSLRIGANGNDGDISLFRGSNTSIETPSEEPSIRLNGDTGDIILQNADCAEDFEIEILEAAEPGTVMVISDGSRLRVSSQAYDRRVVGVIAGAGQFRPGIILGRNRGTKNSLPIALMGRVNCKVEADNISIKVGDLLTTSSIPGHAMKAQYPEKAFGSVIGKALGELDSGKGLIPVLVALQ